MQKQGTKQVFMGTLIAQPNPRQLGTVVCFPRFLHESHGLCEASIARPNPCQCKPLLVQLSVQTLHIQWSIWFFIQHHETQ